MVRSIFTMVYLISAAAACAQAQVTVEPLEDRVRVKLGGEHFTDYIYKGYAKPILYPVIGPHGISMTRNWPMTDAAEGEAKDHPHHKSLWFTHGDVNGVDFWAEGEGKGKITPLGPPTIPTEGVPAHVVGRDVWRDADGRTLCHQHFRMSFGQEGTTRFIDVQVGIWSATGEAVTFGDTKEGTMAIRTRPELEINHGAKAVNSEGQTGKDIWGKRAKWVDYSAEIEGKVVGVAIFDHPDNPRHPTWWHAREYGLIAANPFGIHDFEKKPESAGDLTIAADKSVTFRYRFVFHEGDAEAAKIAELYKQYAEKKGE